MRCDIVIPVWNKKELTQNCIESIIRNTHYPYRIIVIDNASGLDTARYLDKLERNQGLDFLLIRNSENLGFTRAVNQGIEATEAEFICVLNNDTIVTDNWLKEMITIAGLKDNIGIVNPNSNTLGCSPPGNSIDVIETYAKGFLKDKDEYTELGVAIGFCFLIKRALINKIGGLDEIFSPGYFDDTDYSLRAVQAGYKSVCAKGAYVYHTEHASFRDKKLEKIFKENKEKFYQRHGRPKRVLYIVSRYSENYSRVIKKDAYDLARKANWVWIFTKKSLPVLNVPEHGNIRVFSYSPLFFNLKVIIRVLWRQKKKFNLICVTSPGLKKILEILKFAHRAKIQILS